jgi:hypothetical protein
MVKIFRNGRFVHNFSGPPMALDDGALEAAFNAVEKLAEGGQWWVPGEKPK